ncbi:hypothetical protein, partial [Pseudomonas sp. LFS044]|uniref:hypothetical protein n=1 Tax=Pseudomonas sp. LFS044 TaxID=3229880 RepID=UPI003A7FC70A
KNWIMPTRLATMASQAMARCNKCGSGLARDAPRGRRSISRALKIQRQALRDAPRGRRSILRALQLYRLAIANVPPTTLGPAYPSAKTRIDINVMPFIANSA